MPDCFIVVFYVDEDDEKIFAFSAFSDIIKRILKCILDFIRNLENKNGLWFREKNT